MSPLETVYSVTTIDRYYMISTTTIHLFIKTICNMFKFVIFGWGRIFRENRYAYYLKISSIIDTDILLACFSSNTAGPILNVNLVGLSPIWCKIQLMFIYTCGLYSVFTMCCIALDQYLSTNHR